jgi:hypothetical protein
MVIADGAAECTSQVAVNSMNAHGPGPQRSETRESRFTNVLFLHVLHHALGNLERGSDRTAGIAAWRNP